VKSDRDPGDTFDRLKKELSDRAIVELVYIVGFYKMQTIFMRGLEVEYDTDIRGRVVEVAPAGDK
jgi:hypothetical protein